MEIATLVYVLCLLGLFLNLSFRSLAAPMYMGSTGWEQGPDLSAFAEYDYGRFPEVKKACASVLSSASELKMERGRFALLKNEMSFSNGDWRQDSEDMPLMPFDRNYTLIDSSELGDPLYLSSFKVFNVDQDHKSSNAINISGTLDLGIIFGSSFSGGHEFSSSENEMDISPTFQYSPGFSLLKLKFEGVYTESETNNGERVMCLLGTTPLPLHQASGSTDQFEWVNVQGADNRQPLLSSDDQILLILRYPKAFTLTSRAVHGELRSLKENSNPKFFDKVSLSSQLGAYSNYQFGSEKLVSKACSPYPQQDDAVDNRIVFYKGSDLCQLLQLTYGEKLAVVPNWKCNSTDEFCSKLGPFDSKEWIKKTDGGYQNVWLLMQDVRCEPKTDENNVSAARVSAVLRVSPRNQLISRLRTNLDGTTLSLEGVWSSAGGQLCMIGCLGSDMTKCNSRVCMYFSTSFSIKLQTFIVGTISSINDGTTTLPYFPLSFEAIPLWQAQRSGLDDSNITYEFTKLKTAGAFLERNEPFAFDTLLKKSLLRYPSIEEGENENIRLSNLASDLAFDASIIPDKLSNPHLGRATMWIFVLGSQMVQTSSSPAELEDSSAHPMSAFKGEKVLLNVSSALVFTGKTYGNISTLSLEGLYNPFDGKMYLVGCRDVRASWKILFESMDLEDGLDCLIEVIIEYPPTSVPWLVNPSVKISIVSRRNADDPLHFSPINLQTSAILYRKQREDILSEQGVEGVLRICALTIAIGCILSQLFYIRGNNSSLPNISLVMLGIQALGYSIPLITGAEEFFFKKKSEPYDFLPHDLEKTMPHRIISYVVKIFVLAAFLLTVRLGQKVWRSRIRLLTRSPLEPRRVPNDKQVFFICLGVHIVGFVTVLIIRIVGAYSSNGSSVNYPENSRIWREWGIQLEEYVGLAQDFFLLPQIIGNFLWQTNCKPLKKVYYIGITIVRILPHVYDNVRVPSVIPHVLEEDMFVNRSMDFFSKFGDIAIPLIASLLAVVIYYQQRLGCRKLCRSLGSRKVKLLSLGSRVYERLPSANSVSFEAELVSGVNDAASRIHSKNDEPQ